MPASAPSARWTVTPSTTSGAPGAYRNETLSADSNADTHVAGPARSRVAQDLFVAAIEQVQRPHEYLERFHGTPRPAKIDDGMAVVGVEAAGRAKRRFRVERLAAHLHFRKRAPARERERGVD